MKNPVVLPTVSRNAGGNSGPPSQKLWNICPYIENFRTVLPDGRPKVCDRPKANTGGRGQERTVYFRFSAQVRHALRHVPRSHHESEKSPIRAMQSPRCNVWLVPPERVGVRTQSGIVPGNGEGADGDGEQREGGLIHSVCKHY